MTHEIRIKLCGSYVKMARDIKDRAAQLPPVQGSGTAIGFLIGAADDLQAYSERFGNSNHLDAEPLVDYREAIRAALQDLSGFGDQMDGHVLAITRSLNFVEGYHIRMDPISGAKYDHAQCEGR